MEQGCRYKVGASVANHSNQEMTYGFACMMDLQSPLITEVESATGNLEDDARQAYWGEVNEPGNNVVRQEIVEFVPLQDRPAQAQRERWKQAADRELQASLKIAWKEPTPELPSRYFAAKKG